MIKFGSLVIFSLFLTACVSHSPNFSLPKEVKFEDTLYQQVTDNQLGEMRQLLYLPSKSLKDPENWQQGLLFFLDKNSANQSLDQRVALRQKSFDKQPNIWTKFSLEQNELRSQIIYPPTDRFHNVQLELSRGRNLPCGFGQIQFSDRIAVDLKKNTKKSEDLTAYQPKIAELAVKFVQLPWLIECK